MKFEYKVKLTEKDLYHFMMYHNYHGIQGKLGIIVAALAFAAAAVTIGNIEPFYTFAYLACGVVFLLYTPITLRFKAKKQFVLIPDLREDMTYTFDDEKIVSAMKDQSAEVQWIKLFKIVGTKNYLYIYTDRMHSTIIPKEAIGEEFNELADFIELKAPKGKVKIKR